MRTLKQIFKIKKNRSFIYTIPKGNEKGTFNENGARFTLQYKIWHRNCSIRSLANSLGCLILLEP